MAKTKPNAPPLNGLGGLIQRPVKPQQSLEFEMMLSNRNKNATRILEVRHG
jgi:hypothetical protein